MLPLATMIYGIQVVVQVVVQVVAAAETGTVDKEMIDGEQTIGDTREMMKEKTIEEKVGERGTTEEKGDIWMRADEAKIETGVRVSTENMEIAMSLVINGLGDQLIQKRWKSRKYHPMQRKHTHTHTQNLFPLSLAILYMGLANHL